MLPESVMVDELPLQIVAGEAVAAPPTDVGLTITVATLEFVDAQTPLVTTARKSVVVVRLPVLNVSLVWPLILTNALVPVRDCHCTEPMLPESVIVDELPLQIVPGED